MPGGNKVRSNRCQEDSISKVPIGKVQAAGVPWTHLQTITARPKPDPRVGGNRLA